MPMSITNKPQLTGIVILFAGVALLAFTFLNAFLFLQEPLGMIATGDLARVFGDALAPLIQACIRLMYLGIMGWVGSLLTVRGIPLITHKQVIVAVPTVAPQAKRQPQPIKQTIPTPPPREQPKPIPQSQQELQLPAPPESPQAQMPKPVQEPEYEEPKAILIPPEKQREE